MPNVETINSLDRWPPERNYPVPSCFSYWQSELNHIAGFAPNGMPHLRLEWGSTCTWTPYVKDLKYLQRRQTRQIAWGAHAYDAAGNIVKTLRFGLKDNVPEPNKTYGNAFPINIDEEIGIPRFWISQFTPPTLVGPWDEARQRILSKVGSHSDMGAFPREGLYYLGFHLIAHHEGRQCCEKAKLDRRKCFGYYRDPSELDILYVSSLIKERDRNDEQHDWTETADDKTMYKVLKNLNTKHEDQDAKDRAEMRLRIRDAFKSHRARFTSRKGRDSFLFDKIMPGTQF